MKLWIISQTENDDYDTYDSAVVAAKTADDARHIMPGHGEWGDTYSAWCSSPDKVEVKCIGEAAPNTSAGVILASFNAG